MFGQRWQCYILCWGKPRHSVPPLRASAPSDVLLGHTMERTRSMNTFVCTKGEPQHNPPESWFTHFAVRTPFRWRRARVRLPGVLMHPACPRRHHQAKFMSNGIAIAMCSSHLFVWFFFYRREIKTWTCNVCMYNMLSWHWIKRV